MLSSGCPLGAFWLQPSLRLKSHLAWSTTTPCGGGVPRYWELDAGHDDLWSSLTGLMLDPSASCTESPISASILMLAGQGAHRLSEIAARSSLPATALTQPLARLIELGSPHRDLPFGRSTRDSKRTA